jgi:hypothetical protein
MPFEYAPASNLTQINHGSAIASPAMPAPIAEVAVPRVTTVSPRVPFSMVDEIRVGGATPVTAQRLYANPVGIGDTIYEPMRGDFSARPRPSDAPRLNPVNQATATATAPRTATAGGPINPRIPRPSAAGLARGGVSLGVGVALEVAAQAAFNAAFPGASDRAKAYEARNADPRSRVPTRGETVAAGSALGMGGLGLAGVGAAAASRYLLPDDVDPGNPNGLLGRVLGWDEDYPNQLDPAALDVGPTLDPGQPAPFSGGQMVGVSYRVDVVYTDEYRASLSSTTWIPRVFSSFVNSVPGPVKGVVLLSDDWYVQGTNANGSTWSRATGIGGTGCVNSPAYFRGCKCLITGISRMDGQPDTGGNPPPVASPVIAPNPARTRTPNPDGTQNQIPAPPVPLAPVPTPEAPITDWPQTQPQQIPDTQPLAPPLAVPDNFSPPIQTPAPEPTPPPGPPDLDPNAPPRTTPADLATDPDTPPIPARSDAPGGAFDEGTRWSVPFVLPVPVPTGTAQPVNTPSWPNLMERQQPNPNVRFVQQPVTQTPTEGPKGSCFYEFQRVARIEQQATEANTQAKNPTSGFTGLYGIGIESRVKIGESFTLLQQVNQFMRKAWEMTRMQKVLDVLTFIGVMHNVGMLSRDVGETFFQLIGQGVQAAGIRDEEGGVIDVPQVVGDATESFLRRVLGSDVYDGIGTAWNKASRIISTASAVIWTVRSIADSSLDLQEWIGENTGRIGNALKRWGLVGERAYPDMSESARAQGRWRRKFQRFTNEAEAAEDWASNMTIATSTVIEVQEETEELRENWIRFQESVVNGIPDPWIDNTAVQAQREADKAVSDGPDIPPSEAQKG